mmetsp:Transcript_132217/g.410925  ORF Transcript_132217/g.410925 Transcript_132217/m.410925 type:complete len:217 (+) Transcript_132217:93-743(+)
MALSTLSVNLEHALEKLGTPLGAHLAASPFDTPTHALDASSDEETDEAFGLSRPNGFCSFADDADCSNRSEYSTSSTTASSSNCPSTQEAARAAAGATLRAGCSRPTGVFDNMFSPLSEGTQQHDPQFAEGWSSPASASSLRSSVGGGRLGQRFLFGGICLQPHRDGFLGAGPLEERIQAGQLLAARTSACKREGYEPSSSFLACLHRSREEAPSR